MKMNTLSRDLDLPTSSRQTPETLSDAVFAALTFAVFMAFVALLYWGSPA